MSRSLFALLTAALLAGCAPRADERARPASPLEQQLGTKPNDAEVNFALAREAEASGDWLRAEQYYLRAEALGTPDTVVLPRLLRVLVAAQRYGEALDRCKRRLAKAPDDRPTRYVKAALLVALERPRDAERELWALVHAHPDDAAAYLELGKLYRDVDDRKQARAMYEKYLTLAPKGDEAANVRYELEEDPRLQVPQTSAAAPVPAPVAPVPAAPAKEGTP